jgi:hypothetical protein
MRFVTVFVVIWLELIGIVSPNAWRPSDELSIPVTPTIQRQTLFSCPIRYPSGFV